MNEAAEVYAVSLSTIKRWMRQGKIKYVQPYGKGGHVMIVMEDDNAEKVN